MLNSGFSGQQPEVSKSDLFSTIQWLIQDYEKNGLFYSYETELNKKRGRISWNQTIKKVTPFLQDDQLVLMNFLRKKKISTFDTLSIIHANILSLISDHFGVFFNDFLYVNRFKKIDLFNFDYIYHELKTIRYKTNVRRTLKLVDSIELLLQFVGTDNSEFSIATKEFHIIFENALKKFVGHNQLLLDKYVPQAEWEFKLPSSVSQKHCNTQIPDALVENNGSLDIYDAKYYDLSYFLTSTGQKNYKATPVDWYSVGKQFFYNISFDYKSSGLSPGNNYFVFPFQNNRLSMVDIGQISIKLGNSSAQTIILKIIDPIKLLENAYN
ncbi:LlaJI family restriction endonuclease [Pediococcus pentosaceus]|uniref:LlaJI family restriction endonuclease n=1 Tax=Pediococcus pentosaceus TaxID=1255 RepID=UPI003593B7A9